MDITQLENLISELSTAQGYNPIIVSQWQEDAPIESFPVAWIKLPIVSYVEGRDEGIIGHHITVALLDDYSRKDAENKQSRLEKMREDMIEIMSLLSTHEDVVQICKMSITPRCIETTVHGDLAQICRATVESIF